MTRTRHQHPKRRLALLGACVLILAGTALLSACSWFSGSSHRDGQAKDDYMVDAPENGGKDILLIDPDTGRVDNPDKQEGE